MTREFFAGPGLQELEISSVSIGYVQEKEERQERKENQRESIQKGIAVHQTIQRPCECACCLQNENNPILKTNTLFSSQLKRIGKIKETPDDAYISAATAFLV